MMQLSKQAILSIVTVVRNDRKGLSTTLASITAQTARHDIQMIVIDGHSTDDTLVATQGFQIDVLISEPDTGLYDAMNKGLAQATGKYVYFLNAGDSFDTAETVEKIISNFQDDNVIYYCSVEIKSNDVKWLSAPLQSKYFNYKDYLPHHQSIFYPECFYKNNRYNLAFKIQADVDYTARAVKQCNKIFIPLRITHSTLGGFSCQQYKSYKKSLSLAREFHAMYASHTSKKDYSIFKVSKIYAVCMLRHVFVRIFGLNMLYRAMAFVAMRRNQRF
jgi:glycosyltransferase involved in cell wall biosynthesis